VCTSAAPQARRARSRWAELGDGYHTLLDFGATRTELVVAVGSGSIATRAF